MKSAAMDFSQTVPIDPVGVEERISRLTKQSVNKESMLHTLKLAMSMIDLTTLEGNDTEKKIRQLCSKAMHPHDSAEGIPPVAAVCVYPNMVRIAKSVLKNSTVRVASVAAAFPSGMTSLEIKIAETKWAVSEGADEIDMVISRGKFLEGEFNYVFDEVAEIKSACGKALMKVILETGELGTLENVRMASDIAIRAGADFIKTSTGKIQPAATLPATLVMMDAIRDYNSATGKKTGIKPAGGIKTTEQAIPYLILVSETLGSDWLTPGLFRFGASSLASDLALQIVKEQTKP
jgi:deoxyribose-phosphate aldolase